MRNYAETCKGICGYNLAHKFFVYLLPIKTFLWCAFQTHLAWEGGTCKTWFLE